MRIHWSTARTLGCFSCLALVGCFAAGAKPPAANAPCKTSDGCPSGYQCLPATRGGAGTFCCQDGNTCGPAGSGGSGASYDGPGVPIDGTSTSDRPPLPDGPRDVPSAGGAGGAGDVPSAGGAGGAGGIVPMDGALAGTGGGMVGGAFGGDGGLGGAAGAIGTGGSSANGDGSVLGGGTGGSGGATTKGNGEACLAGSECASGQCAEGICCNAACTGQCESCASPSSPGACVPVTTPRTPCSGSGPCGGRCDGTSRSACVYPTNTTPCGAAASCTNGTATTAAVCNGSGACSPSTTMSCQFGCQPGGTTCAGSCPAGQKPCDGACIPDAQCCGGCGGSTPVCENGTCIARRNGEACSVSTECASGTCSSEGVCCNLACTGQCESCLSTASRGTCVPVTTPRSPCGSGRCAGQCDGLTRTACAYPAAETQCTPATCADGTSIPASLCNGSGACTSPTATACTWGCQPGTTTCAACRVPGSANLLPNPGFDGSATPWAAFSSYRSHDADSCIGSGSVALLTISDQIAQCLTARAGVEYFLSFRFRAETSAQTTGYCGVTFFSRADCDSDAIEDSFAASTTSGGSWARAVTASGVASANAVSMQVYCIAALGFGYYDQLYLGTSSSATF